MHLGVLPVTTGLDGGLAFEHVGALAAEEVAFLGLVQGLFVTTVAIDEDDNGA